jgi:hypothetical protein
MTFFSMLFAVQKLAHVIKNKSRSRNCFKMVSKELDDLGIEPRTSSKRLAAFGAAEDAKKALYH